MKWTPGGSEQNVEDRRGESGGGGFGGGGMRVGGIGGAIVVLVLSLLFGRDIFSGGGDTGAGPGTSPTTQAPATTSSGEVASTASEEQLKQFVVFVLNDVQDVWRKQLGDRHVPYEDAKLVLFRDDTRSGCGDAQAAMGPFYCPLDQKVYVDLGFYDELKRRFGAPGDFAQAYVIAHELGHHVQHLLGIDAQARRREQSDPANANQVSVRLELQADCYAGVWGHSTEQRRLLQQGDIEEGLNAAAAVGDDRIQQQTRGSVHPESFTHGSAAQRSAWFNRGLTSGSIDACDTFGDRGP